MALNTSSLSSSTSPGWSAEVSIRHIAWEDLPALEWDGEYAHFRRLYRETYQSMCQGRTLMWAAEMPSAGIIGQVFVQLNSSRQELADGGTRAYIYGFRVRPAYRRSGLGRRMLQTVEADLRGRQFHLVTLNVGRQNIDALRFYLRYGYRIISAEPGIWSYIDDKGARQEVHEPAWRMEKRLY